MTTFLYARTSTDKQDNGLEVQVARLQEWSRARGIPNPELLTEQVSARTVRRRPVLRSAMDALDNGGGQLVVTTLTRLSRSLQDFGSIVERAHKQGKEKKPWTVVVLDMGGGDALDTSTPGGFAMANMAMVFAQWERMVIAERIKAALVKVRARGVQLGHPSTVPQSTKRRIAKLRRTMTFKQVVAKLNADGVPTPSGKGRWHVATVQRHSATD